MTLGAHKDALQQELEGFRQQGLFKSERVITTPQQVRVDVGNRTLVNFCANNYLGLAQHPDVIQAAHEGLDSWGYGMASVRFICGTQTPHKLLEEKLSQFLGMEDTILYPSCFDANGGLFETILSEHDAVISDELNHASIIDGVRLCKARRFRYKNSDMGDLETQLQEADRQGARFKLITSDGVFSMDGFIAKLDQICDLAERYHALVHIDDCHATGFVGAEGRGTHEHHDCMGRVDIITSTLGKALGGASGGFTAAPREIVALLRQRSRPYLCSNTLAPPVVAGAIKAVDLLQQATELRARLQENTVYFRAGMQDLGFDVLPGDHPIVPVMFYDAARASRMADEMLKHGVYVVAFSYPVVPVGQARIRTQISANLTREDLTAVLRAFEKSYAAVGETG